MKSLLAFALITLVGFANVAQADSQLPKAKPYPMQTCFISGEKLGDMGKPVVFVHEGQEIKLCCKDCKKQFEKDPAAAMKKFEEAKKKAGKDSSDANIRQTL